MTEGHALIATEVLASYVADAAREVAGVAALVGRSDGVRVSREDGRVDVELRVALEWGTDAAGVGARLQTRVAESLARLADVRPASVDVVVAEWHSASSA